MYQRVGHEFKKKSFHKNEFNYSYLCLIYSIERDIKECSSDDLSPESVTNRGILHVIMKIDLIMPIQIIHDTFLNPHVI